MCIRDSDYKMVVMAGGEILERFKQKREGFDSTKYNDLTMDAKGKLNGDFSK